MKLLIIININEARNEARRELGPAQQRKCKRLCLNYNTQLISPVISANFRPFVFQMHFDEVQTLLLPHSSFNISSISPRCWLVRVRVYAFKFKHNSHRWHHPSLSLLPFNLIRKFLNCNQFT